MKTKNQLDWPERKRRLDATRARIGHDIESRELQGALVNRLQIPAPHITAHRNGMFRPNTCPCKNGHFVLDFGIQDFIEYAEAMFRQYRDPKAAASLRAVWGLRPWNRNGSNGHNQGGLNGRS